MTNPAYECYDHIGCPVYVLEQDEKGVPTYVAFNTFALECSNLRPEDVIGKTARDFFPGPLGEAVFERQIKAFSSNTQFVYEIQLPVSDTLPWFRTTLSPVLDSNGHVERFIGISIDISAEKEAEALRGALSSASSEMEQFVAIAAHDLRTPMRNVQILTEMLRDGFEDHGDGKVDLIDLLEEVASKSGNLIKDVLDHTQTANTAPQNTSFDFGALCQNMYGVLDPRGLHNISWPAAVLQADKMAFQIVLRNLLDNSIKHGNRDRIEIEISVTQHMTGWVSVTVRDNGDGFDNPATVFLDSGNIRSDSGYGLLGVCRIITARGGTISAASPKETAGSCVTFTLPGLILNTQTVEEQTGPQRRSASGD